MQRLLQRLEDNLKPLLHDTNRFCLAYSGGLDSHVLLHAIVNLHDSKRISVPLHAFHVNHGLSPNASKWTEHCYTVCAALLVPIEVIEVDAHAGQGESPEAKAREARYLALKSMVEEGDTWLTAHHRDDQAETFLLQLLRGAGVEGLSAMANVQPFAAARIARPLLNITRQDIYDYAQQANLRWVEDESNQQTHFDRNFLRHELMPVLQKRWPSAAKTISRSASHCAAAAHLLRDEAEHLLTTVLGSRADRLSVAKLLSVTSEQQAVVLRHWVHQLGFALPTAAHIQQIQSVLVAKVDATPMIHWRNVEIRRYRDELYILSSLSEHDARQQLDWALQDSLDLGSLGRLELRPNEPGRGLSLTQFGESGKVQVRFRQGGERCQPQGRNTHSLKKLMQEWGIPPWQRNRVPLLYADGQLIAVAGYAVCEGYQAAPDELGYRLLWCPA